MKKLTLFFLPFLSSICFGQIKFTITAAQQRAELALLGAGLNTLAVHADTIVSSHLGDAPLNEMFGFWAKPVGGNAKIFIGGDDKAGVKMYELDSITQPISKDSGYRLGYFRYMDYMKDGDYWYAVGTEEGWPYSSTGSSLMKARFHPRNIMYSARIYRPTVSNVIGATTARNYWDGNIVKNPITLQYVWVYQKWKDEGDDMTAARVLVANNIEGPYTEVAGDIIDSVYAEANGFPRCCGYEGDPKIYFTQDGRCWLFFIWANTRNDVGQHGAGFVELNPHTYKRIGDIVKLKQGPTTNTSVAGSGKYNFCDVAVPSNMVSNHRGNELGIHEPTPIKIGDTTYIYMPHAGDKNNPYDFAAGGHVITLPYDSMPAATPISYVNDPAANWNFSIAGNDSATAFTSTTGAEGVKIEYHSPNKLRLTPTIDADGIHLNDDGYIQIETSLYSNKYEVEITFNAGAADIYYLFGDWPHKQGSNRQNTIRLNSDQVQVMHEDGQVINWLSGFSLSNYGQVTTLKIVNNGTNAELFINGVSQGTRTAPTSKIRLSMVGSGVSGGFQIPQATHLFSGVISSFKLIDLN